MDVDPAKLFFLFALWLSIIKWNSLNHVPLVGAPLLVMGNSQTSCTLYNHLCKAWQISDARLNEAEKLSTEAWEAVNWEAHYLLAIVRWRNSCIQRLLPNEKGKTKVEVDCASRKSEQCGLNWRCLFDITTMKQFSGWLSSACCWLCHSSEIFKPVRLYLPLGSPSCYSYLLQQTGVTWLILTTLGKTWTPKSNLWQIVRGFHVLQFGFRIDGSWNTWLASTTLF